MIKRNSIIDTDEILYQENIASRALRFVNYIIDGTIIIGLLVLLIPIYRLLFQLLLKDLNEFLMILSFIIFFNSIYFLYYFGFEYLTHGKTLGKYITQTRSVKESGESLSRTDFLKRSLARLIPFEGITIFFADQLFHDAAAKTTVVKEIGKQATFEQF